MSFSIPAALAPPPGGQAWLQIGGVIVPLPVAIDPGEREFAAERERAAEREPAAELVPAAEREPAEHPGASASTPTSEPEVLTERRLRSSELALQAAEARASEAQRSSAVLTARLEELGRELEAARAALRERDGARRVAEQRAHAESARRLELQEELARVVDEHDEVQEGLQRLATMRERVRELEGELVRMQRRLDEAEQIAAAARAARQRAERTLASAAKVSGRQQLLTREQRLAEASRTGGLSSGGPAPLAPTARGARELSLEQRLVAARAAPSEPLQAEPAPEAPGEAVQAEPAREAPRETLPARSSPRFEPEGPPPTPLAPLAPDPAGARLRSVLSVLRRELSQLRALTERERALRIQAETRVVVLERQLRASRHRSELAFEAIDGLRQELGRVYEAFRALGAPSPPSGRSRSSEPSPPSGLSRPSGQAPPLGPPPLSEQSSPSRRPLPAASSQSFPPLPSAPPGSWGRLVPDEPHESSSVPDEPREPESEELPPRSEPPASRGAAALDPTRLDAALTRLREADLVIEPTSTTSRPAQPEPDTPSEPAVRPWLEPVFRSLTRADPLTAGRLALALLPAHGLLRSDPLEYDLVLAETGCVRVSIPGDGAPAHAVLSDEPRSDEAVRFAVEGDLASLARLLAGASTRRRLGAGRARIRGDRAAARSLLDLVRAPRSWRELLDAGVVLEPWLAVSIAARMIDPAWTRGQSFTIAFQAPEVRAPQVLLRVRSGHVTAVETVLAPSAATEVMVASSSVAEVLAGSLEAMAELRGPTRPLALLLSWIERAQSG